MVFDFEDAAEEEIVWALAIAGLEAVKAEAGVGHGEVGAVGGPGRVHGYGVVGPGGEDAGFEAVREGGVRGVGRVAVVGEPVCGRGGGRFGEVKEHQPRTYGPNAGGGEVVDEDRVAGVDPFACGPGVVAGGGSSKGMRRQDIEDAIEDVGAGKEVALGEEVVGAAEVGQDARGPSAREQFLVRLEGGGLRAYDADGIVLCGPEFGAVPEFEGAPITGKLVEAAGRGDESRQFHLKVAEAGLEPALCGL